MIKNFYKIPVHSAEVTSMQFAGPHQEAIVCAGRRFILRVFDPEKLVVTRQNQLIQSELTALHVSSDHIWVGSGNGQLLKLNPKDLSVIESIPLHKDCVSGILESENQFITIGFDGIINFLDKRNKAIVRTLNVDSPPTQILKFNDQYYLAGVQSYLIDQQFNIRQIDRYDQFADVHGRLFGTNDRHGLTYISMNDKKYVPCERMVPYKQGLLGTSWQTATYFMYDEEERISWKSARVTGFQPGDSITTLLARGSRIFGGGESGNIYAFSFDEKYSILDC